MWHSRACEQSKGRFRLWASRQSHHVKVVVTRSAYLRLVQIASVCFGHKKSGEKSGFELAMIRAAPKKSSRTLAKALPAGPKLHLAAVKGLMRMSYPTLETAVRTAGKVNCVRGVGENLTTSLTDPFNCEEAKTPLPSSAAPSSLPHRERPGKTGCYSAPHRDVCRRPIGHDTAALTDGRRLIHAEGKAASPLR